MEDIDFKHIVYQEIATFVSALGEPKRLEILELLSQCERNVESLAKILGQKISTTSHHLQILKRARLIKERKEGRFVYYLASSTGLRLWNTVSGIAAEENAEVKYALSQIFSEDRDAEKLDYSEITRRVAAGEAVLIDVRPEEEYHSFHIPGAVSVPLEKLNEQTSSFPRDRQIFAYCRGRYCILSHEAVMALKNEGYNATRVETGMAEWKAGVL
jgi:rhodanese-related sulfurtransferase/DNA-binding MarR family transcriptional regulator